MEMYKFIDMLEYRLAVGFGIILYSCFGLQQQRFEASFNISASLFVWLFLLLPISLFIFCSVHRLHLSMHDGE